MLTFREFEKAVRLLAAKTGESPRVSSLDGDFTALFKDITIKGRKSSRVLTVMFGETRRHQSMVNVDILLGV